MLIAVDIALLPSERDIPLLLEWNARLLAERDGAIRLAAEERPGCGLPHVSLAMGVLEAGRAPAVGDALAPLGPSLSVPTEGLGSTREGLRTVTSLSLATTTELQDLQGAVLDIVRPHFTATPATAEMFAEAELDAPGETSCRWVTSYDRESTGKHFDPHVTLGYGDAELLRPAAPSAAMELPVLGLFHLGASCTCRRTLWRSDR